jgi:hypothetical protein
MRSTLRRLSKLGSRPWTTAPPGTPP